MNTTTVIKSLMVSTLVAIVAAGTGCARSRAELLRDRSAYVEQKLEAERDRVLVNTAPAERDARLSHLQNLRLGLSVVNVSIVSVPVMLKSEDERAIGYSVLDEAVGTIDWNIPIYAGGAAGLRPYPALFSPQTGLDFAAIRKGDGVKGIAK